MIATVSTGKRRVGMSSLIGTTSSAQVRAAARRSCLAAGARERLLGVVARANQRPRRHGLEALRVRLALELGELLGMPVAHHRKVVARGPQVLADREHLDLVLAQNPKRLDQLF